MSCIKSVRSWKSPSVLSVVKAKLPGLEPHISQLLDVEVGHDFPLDDFLEPRAIPERDSAENYWLLNL